MEEELLQQPNEQSIRSDLAAEESTQSPSKLQDSSLPLAQRLKSKEWNTRSAAIDELHDKFKGASQNCSSKAFTDYATKWPEILQDANASCLEKALEAMQTWLHKASQELVSDFQYGLLKALTEKCISHTKANIKSQALENSKLIFEVSENFDEETLDGLEEICKSIKLPTKIASVCLLSNLITAYGVKRLPVDRFKPYIEAMANNASQSAKNEALSCYKAVYLWVADEIDTVLDSLKPPQREYIHKQVVQHTATNYKRLLRSEKTSTSGQEEPSEAKAEAVEEVKEIETKPFLETINSEWVQACSALKVWDQKRDKLQELVGCLEKSEVFDSEGNYTELIELCKKYLSDTHVLVQQLAVKSLGLLSKALKTHFPLDTLKDLFPLLLKKQTEKKLCDDIQTTLLNFISSVDSIQSLLDIIITGLKDKIPAVSRGTALLVEKQLYTTYIDVVEEIESEVAPLLVQMGDSSNKETSEIGLKCLGVLLGRLAKGQQGQEVLDKYTENVASVKKAKIEESFNQVQPHSEFDKSFKPKVNVQPKKSKANSNNQIMDESQEQPQVEPAQNESVVNAADELPIGKSTNNNQMLDEYPPGGGPPPSTGAGDEIPIGKGVNKNQMVDEYPPGQGPPKVEEEVKEPVKPAASSAMDEMPIGKSNNNNQMMSEFPPGYVPPADDENALVNEPPKPVKKRPMLSSQRNPPKKKQPTTQASEEKQPDAAEATEEKKPAAVDPSDDLPVGKSNNNNQMLDEYPPGGGPPPATGAGDDIPIGKGVNKNQMLDEYPPGGGPPPMSSGAGDEIPIGKGVNKNQMLDAYPPGGGPPAEDDSLNVAMDPPKIVKKKPVLGARAKKVAPVKAESDATQAMDVDEMPIGKATNKNQMMSEYPPGGGPPASADDLPIGKATNKNSMMSEYPPGGGPPTGGDELPIGKATNKNQMMSEYPPGGGPPVAGPGDELPINSGKNNTMTEEFANPAQAAEAVVFKVKANPVRPEPRNAKGKDDDGAAMEKEEAIDIVKGFYHEENVKQFESAKWQDKVQGFKGLIGEVEANKPDAMSIQATAMFVKTKMKDWKESNMNMIKESINLFLKIAECCERIPKKALSIYAPFLCEKIGEVKYGTPIKQLITMLCETITAKYVATQVTKCLMTSKNPKNLQESAKWITETLDEWGGGMMPVKECIDFATVCANSTSGPVRTASMQLFAILYKHLGETVKNYLSDIKESTMKLIEEEFKKVTPLKKGEFKAKKELKGEAAEEVKASGGAAASMEDGLPREDISKLLTAKLLAGYKAKEWGTRKGVSDSIMEILKGAKMRIQPAGIMDMMETLKAQMKESNKAVIKANIQLMGQLAVALGPGIKPYVRKCFVPLIFNLSDKQSLVRKDVIEAMNKWGEAIGPEIVITWATVQMETENPELREESLQWILANKEGIKAADHSVMVKPLTMCLNDKVAKTRTKAEEVIVEVMQIVGTEPFMRECKDMKTAVQQTVKPILEKAKQKAGAAAAKAGQTMAQGAEPEADPREESKQAPGKKPTVKGGATAKPSGPTLKTPAGPTLKSKEDAPSVRTNDRLRGKAEPEEEQSRPLTTRGATAVKSSMPIPQDNDDMLIVHAGNKDRRNDNRIKWLHDEMKTDQVDKVKHACESIYGYEFMQKMFSTDFKKHLEVLKQFQELIDQQPQNLLDTLDVIIKWSCIKLAESQNTTFAGQLFDFYFGLFDFLVQEDYQLCEGESYVLVPMICDKMGLNNAILKEKAKQLMRKVFTIMNDKSCCVLMLKFGVGAKNLKSVAETLAELTFYIKESGLDNITEKDLQQVAKLVDSNDKGVRETSLTFIGEVYNTLDEAIWGVLGKNVNVKVKGLLEARFKQIKKGTTGGNPMNRSINNAEPQRRSVVPSIQKQASDTRNNTLNKSLNKSLVSKDISATPRRGLAPKSTQSSIALSKSIKKDNPMNSSINSNGGGLSRLAQTQQQHQRPGTSQPPQQNTNQRTTLKFQSSSQERVAQNQQPQQQQMQTPGMFADQGYSQQHKSVMERDQMIFHDDDDDLMQNINELKEPKEQMDPKLKEQIDFIMKHVQSLKNGDLSKRVDSLVALNDIMLRIQQYNAAIIRCSNELCSSFTHVLIDVFERQLIDIPLRFAKYFVTIVNRVCQSPEVMTAANEAETYELTEQLLMRLLTDNLDKLGDNKEGEVILKTLNAAMLRLLENCKPTLIYCALYNMLRKYKDYTILPKLPGLVIKCLLKLAKIIEKQTSELEIDKVLLVIHEYLLVINHDEKSQNDEMGIRITKTVINELVKIKGESIWESYKLVEKHVKTDNHISRWISLILSQPSKNLNDTAPTFGGAQEPAQVQKPQQVQQPQNDNKEIKQIIDELRSTDLFESAIKKLHHYLQRHPHESLDTYLKDLSQHFGNFIRTHLETYQNSLVETGSTPEPQESPISKPPKNQMSAMGSERKMSPFAAQRQSSGLQPSRLQQPPQVQQQTGSRPSPFNTSGTTGGRAPTTSVGHESSEQRIGTYQDKLSTMKERLQKQGSSGNLHQAAETGNQPQPTEQKQIQTPSKLPPTLGQRTGGYQGSLIGSAQKVQAGDKPSLGQMNSSLSQKWKQISTRPAPVAAEQPQPAAQQATAEQTGTSMNELNQLRQQNAERPSFIGAGGGQATQSDLQQRLAQMKAKLQQIKK